MACYFDKGSAPFSKNPHQSALVPEVNFIPRLCTSHSFIFTIPHKHIHLSFNSPPSLCKAAQTSAFFILKQVKLRCLFFKTSIGFSHPHNLYCVHSLISLILCCGRQQSTPTRIAAQHHKAGKKNEAKLDRRYSQYHHHCIDLVAFIFKKKKVVPSLCLFSSHLVIQRILFCSALFHINGIYNQALEHLVSVQNFF